MGNLRDALAIALLGIFLLLLGLCIVLGAPILLLIDKLRLRANQRKGALKLFVLSESDLMRRRNSRASAGLLSTC